MKKTVEIEVAKLRSLYQGGDEKTREALEAMYGKDILVADDDEMLERVTQILSENDIRDDDEIQSAIDWVEALRARKAIPETSQKVEPWAIKNKDGKVIGVGVPIINKAFYFDQCPKEEMNWDDAMKYAKKLGRKLPTKKELVLCWFFKDEINAIAEAAGHPDFLSGYIWSSTEYNTLSAWYVGFGSGLVDGYNTKYYATYVVRPVADI